MPQTREHQESMAKIVCELLSDQDPLERELPAWDADEGAVLDFRGVVRRIENGRRLRGIDYEAHETMAAVQLERLAAETAARFKVKQIVIRHRTGFVAVDAPSLIIRITSAHRAETLLAMTAVIDELKKKVPIWKHPVFAEEEA